MITFILILILIIGIWTGLNFMAQSNGFLPALLVPVAISLIIDAAIIFFTGY